MWLIDWFIYLLRGICCPNYQTTKLEATMISSTAAKIGRPSSSPLSLLLKPQTSRRILTPSASFSSSLPSRKLILYSKPGCCLCDGLKEKLHAAFLLSGPDSLHDVHLQVLNSLPSHFFFLLKPLQFHFFCFVSSRWGISLLTLNGRELTSMRFLCLPKSALMARRLVLFIHSCQFWLAPPDILFLAVIAYSERVCLYFGFTELFFALLI